MSLRRMIRIGLVMAGFFSFGTAQAAISVLSSRPDMVSGGDALIAVTGAGPITLNGADVSSMFQGAGGKRIGLVEGLKLGTNTVKAGGGSLTLFNHPITGPLFSGPHETPFICMTEKFKLPASTLTLGPPVDADCSVETRLDFVYRGKDNAFHPLPDGAAPADVAMTTTSTGKTVPYIVRVETGTINRAIYQTAMLAQPGQSVSPQTSMPNWNGRLVYTFGGGCVGGWYIQGANLGNRGILEDLMLRQGYAVASASLNVYGNNCAMVLAAETAAMVKERFIKTYGVPGFTIGFGCSGGSEQLHPIADLYPGIVDGIIVGCSFPEVVGGMVLNLSDADLISHYFKTTKMGWSDKEKAAAAGYPNATTASTLAGLAVRIKAEGGSCNEAIAQASRFSRAGNPHGTRCDVYDHAVNIFGRDATGAARRSWDNIGVQYGLMALKDGKISARQFLDLNRDIGGFDNDGNYVPARGEADAIALKRVYETGQVTYGGLGLRSTPIIDYRGYVDAPENSNENHSRFHSFSMRARLEKANGSAANQVMLVESGLPGTKGLFSDESPVLSRALTQMDAWLTNVKAGGGARPTLAAIAKARPADLSDACFTDGGTVKIAETQIYRGDTRCNALYPAYATPRLAAGEPLANNVLKCRLKPTDLKDYGGRLGKDDGAELKSLFPKGVCDYAKPGVAQVPTKAVWQKF